MRDRKRPSTKFAIVAIFLLTVFAIIANIPSSTHRHEEARADLPMSI